MHALDAIHLSNAVSSLAFLALGAWVLAAGRGPVKVAFATYAFAWGATVLTSNLYLEVGHVSRGVAIFNAFTSFLLVAALATLAALYPARLSRRDAPSLAAAAVTFAAVVLLAPPVGDLGVPGGEPMRILVVAGIIGLSAGLWAVLVFLALRWRSAKPGDRPSIALVSAALVLWSAFSAGHALAARSATPVVGVGAIDAVLVLVFTGIWLWNTASGGGKQARAVAWVALGSTLVALVERQVFPDAPDLWGYGIGRLVGVAMLAYAIVRHQLLGIDVKVRWTISKSTIAAVFIAVFFVASETAQQFFGDTLGSTYVGIAAAGALVFAMAPLHRAAEKLAEKAVPPAPLPAPGRVPADPRANAGPSAAEAAYASALRIALRDRALTRAEEVELAHLAEHLGIGAGRAAALLAEAERAARGEREVAAQEESPR